MLNHGKPLNKEDLLKWLDDWQVYASAYLFGGDGRARLYVRAGQFKVTVKDSITGLFLERIQDAPEETKYEGADIEKALETFNSFI